MAPPTRPRSTPLPGSPRTEIETSAPSGWRSSSIGADERARDLARWEHALAEATRNVRILPAVAPTNAEVERRRLVAAFERGVPSNPRWTYARVDLGRWRQALHAMADELADDDHPLAPLFAARARELELEARVAEAAGTSMLGELAAARFRSVDARTAHVAREVARAWVSEGEEQAPAEWLESDAEVEGSLVSRMREEVGARRWPFAVVVAPSLVALAATGDRQIFVAAGRRVTKEDVERTVLHELEGHARPRVRAAASTLGILRSGTARGVDDQEGLALALEERHAFLSPRRRRELGARHVTVAAMDDGATFAEAVLALQKIHGWRVADAVRIAERVYRGSPGTGAGLGRERIYIEAFVRVRDAIQNDPSVEDVLASGQVGLDAVHVLAAIVGAASKPRAVAP